MPHSQNRILSKISSVDMEDLRPRLRVVELPQGTVIAESRSRVNKVYFPHGGILSCVVELEDGWTIESGMIGNDGVFGAGQAIDGKTSLHKVVVQVPGSASVVDAAHLSCPAPRLRVPSDRSRSLRSGVWHQWRKGATWRSRHHLPIGIGF
jgi:hypothetical protein